MSEADADRLTSHSNATIKDKIIKVAGGSNELFQVLELIKPLEIKLVERLELDLTEIFLQLTGYTIDV